MTFHPFDMYCKLSCIIYYVVLTEHCLLSSSSFFPLSFISNHCFFILFWSVWGGVGEGTGLGWFFSDIFFWSSRLMFLTTTQLPGQTRVRDRWRVFGHQSGEEVRHAGNLAHDWLRRHEAQCLGVS